MRSNSDRRIKTLVKKIKQNRSGALVNGRELASPPAEAYLNSEGGRSTLSLSVRKNDKEDSPKVDREGV